MRNEGMEEKEEKAMNRNSKIMMSLFTRNLKKSSLNSTTANQKIADKVSENYKVRGN